VDQIRSQVDRLSELTDEQISALQGQIISEFESYESQEPTAESVDAMTSLADMLDAVRGETKQREMAAQELASQAAEAAMRVKGSDEETMEGDMPSEDMPVEEMPATPEDMPVEGEPVEEAPVEEVVETPEEEDDEYKKKKAESEYSTESVDASATAVEGSELSSEENPTAEVVEETPAPEETPAEVVEDTPAEVPAEDTEFSTEEPNSSTIAQEEQEGQAPVTATAEQPFEAPADRQPVVQVSEPAPVAITAGADIPGYTAGSPINDMYEVAQAMEKRIHSLRRVNGGDGEQHIVASLTTQYPEERTLSTDAESNMAKIQAVAGPEALVASGGHAAPFEVKYDIYSIGSTNVRPVRDSLPRFQADRGGIRFVTPPSLALGFTANGSDYTTYANAVGQWTASTDLTPGGATKTSLQVTAAYENTVSTYAMTLQVKFGNLMTRAYPELIARHNELALVQHAREAEQALVSAIDTASTAVTTTNLIGFGRDFLVQVRRAAVAFRQRHRLAPETQLNCVIPVWFYDAMAADLTLAMPGDGTLSVSKSEIDGYLSALNVTVTPYLDSNTSSNNLLGAQSGSAALNEFPDNLVWYLFAEGTFIFLDGGTLDLGIVRDSTLVGTNDYIMFLETFENVAKVGIESLKITSTISVNGVAAALRDTTGNTAAATIEL
jgi:chemotaxis protein histidine kinase CheA